MKYTSLQQKKVEKKLIYIKIATIVQSICIAVDPVYTEFRLLFCFPLDSALYKFH